MDSWGDSSGRAHASKHSSLNSNPSTTKNKMKNIYIKKCSTSLAIKEMQNGKGIDMLSHPSQNGYHQQDKYNQSC
jgi:hypothetical protein